MAGASSATTQRSALDAELFGAPGAVPRHRRRDPRLRGLRAARARVRRAARRGHRSPGARRCCAPPGEFGADVAVGSAAALRRAARLRRARTRPSSPTREEHKRQLPGRIIGVSRDAHGRAGAAHGAADPRAAHPPRQGHQQHLHGAGAARGDGRHVRRLPRTGGPGARSPSACTAWPRSWRAGLAELGCELRPRALLRHAARRARRGRRPRSLARAVERGINLRAYPDDPRSVGVALDETVTAAELGDLLEIFGGRAGDARRAWPPRPRAACPRPTRARSHYLTHPVFNTHHSEHEMLRYLRRLESRDLSLTTSMIPLGSCTMKLNATTEMLPRHLAGVRRPAPLRPGRPDPGLPPSSSATSSAGWPRSPASRRSRCSPTPARRASTPACW